MTTKQYEMSLKMTSLELAGNQDDPEASDWVHGIVPDNEFAEHEAFFGRDPDGSLTEKRYVSVWAYRQARDNNGRLRYIELETIRAFANGTITYHDFQRLLGPWYGTYQGAGEPRVIPLTVG